MYERKSLPVRMRSPMMLPSNSVSCALVPPTSSRIGLPGLNSALSLSSKVCASMFPALNFSVALPMRFKARRTEADTSEKVSFSLLPFT